MSTTPSELLDRAEGKTLGQIARQGIGGFLLSISTAAIAAVLTGIDFLLIPLEVTIDIIGTAINMLVLTPLRLLIPGLNVSAQNLGQFGFLALPVSSAVALTTVLVFVGFLALGITGNLGLILDNPLVDRLTGTPEEEFDDED